MRAPRERLPKRYEPAGKGRPNLRLVEPAPQAPAEAKTRRQESEKRKIIVLERLQKVQKPRNLPQKKLEKLPVDKRQSHIAQARAYEAYRAEKARRARVREEMGGGLLSPGYLTNKEAIVLERRQKESAEKTKNRDTLFTTSFWRNLPYAAMAVFTGLNVNQALDARTAAAASEPARASTLEETQRPDPEWMIRAESTVTFGGPDSPFVDLFDEEHDTISLPNLFFGQDGTNLFGTIKVGREDQAMLRGPELLQRLWDIKCGASGSHALSTLRDERVGAYSAAVENGTLQRSSLALEMARMSGFERGTTYTNAIWGHIRWDELGRDREMTAYNLALARDITGFLSPAHIEAIILAEIAPQMSLPNTGREEAQQARQAHINIRLYDFILRQYGREFINDFPALGDPLVSVGGVQSTHWVLGEHRSTGIINGYLDPEAYALLALPDGEGGMKTSIAEDPSRVGSLDEQRAIAYMNAVYNVIFAIETSTQAREGFDRIRDGIVGGTPEMRMLAQERLAEFLFSHNNPREAAKALGAWATHGRRLSLENQLAVPIARFADERNHVEYATSMRFNYIALEEQLAPVLSNEEIRSRAIDERGEDPTITFPEDTERWNEIRRNVRRSIG